MNSDNAPETFAKRVLINIAIVLLIVSILIIAIYVFDVILLLFGAILAAVFLHGLATISRRYLRLSQGVSVMLVSALLLAVLAFGV